MVLPIVRVRALPVAVATALTLAASPAAAGPLADPAPWVLPVNAFGKARAGDWTLLEGETAIEGRMVPQRQILRVTRVERGVAHVQLFAGPAGAEQWLLTFPVGAATAVVTFSVDATGAATDVRLEGKPPAPVARCLRTQLAGLRLDASASGHTGRVRARAVFDPGTTRPPPRPRKPRLISPGHPLRGGPDLRGVTLTLSP